MAPLTLVREFPAMEPQMIFRPMSYEEFHNTWSEPVDTIHRAIIGLTEDIAMFQAMSLHKRQTAAGEEFLQSLLYYSQVLILDSLVKIRGRLRAYATTSALPGNETVQSIGSKLTDAQDAFDRFSAITSQVLDEASWTFRWKTPSVGDKVPTTSPYQALYQSICINKLSSAPTVPVTDVLASLAKKQKLSLPNLPPGIERVNFEKCGRPTMLFVAATPDRSRIVFGANETSWGTLTALSAITRMARDIRVQQYIPRAMKAFRALRRKEEEALVELRRNPSARTLSDKELKYRSRLAAIEKMRLDESFLGGGNEIGIALKPPSWKFNQGCYLCQGMMGYQSPNLQVSEKERKSYILQFK
ncbi:hypothetical protein TRIATDRAFT_306808 [Trichoderma atroviride IMI 206040]|uniref:Uncharacterized protein n=1 Tax=Hypocrea atroviridis (strain ATCC 20476 / IMI 206040) TaxID=452589 RepID=G9NPT1_HYPAI|nr:uncharacterized protein TRIATDRAFT_306808 [Trichoderma atroviride IMI 206040]EHK47084.1 hypothetical protein TRIATDRAFT_306808 [Trichoderma atroviride IMI 206040]